MEYYYTQHSLIDISTSTLLIKGNEFLHLTKVLRKSENDIIFVTDGELNVFECKIKEKRNSELICSIINKKSGILEPKLKVTLCLCLLKNLDRFEFAVEKAVEIGVYSIYPVLSEFTINKTGLSQLKIKRLNSIVLSAMKQSQRCFLPKVNNNILFNDLKKLSENFVHKIVMYEFENSANKIDNRKLNNNCLLLIGPEGGFSKKEISELIADDWKTFSLGERKLRAETAAVISAYEILKNYN
jgi:16S rRNA (uracil1498-N3)-methyltransferase